MTQRTASTRFDLPQPFGPTTPVSPGSIRKSVGSTKDLKPESRSRWKCTAPPLRPASGMERRGGLRQCQRLVVALAVDEEGRRGVDPVLVVLGDAGVERVEALLVVDA